MEDVLVKSILNFRRSFVNGQKTVSWILGITQSFSIVTVILMPVLVFAILASKNELSALVVYPGIVLFAQIAQPLLQASMLVQSIATYSKSYARINEYLLAEEMTEDLKVERRNTDDNLAISMQAMTSSYENLSNDKDSNPFYLDSITMDIEKGKLIAIVGPVGSGKTSLLRSIAGSMMRISGKGVVAGEISYATQQPWIKTGTVQENIVFHNDMVTEKLNNAIQCCSLATDLQQLRDGLDTQLGEEGVNLSGGQKARLQLARTIYSNADVCLLDDPLAALDSHVSAQVFNNAIKGALKSKTVLLVTHQLYILPEVDEVIVMESGRIVEKGTFASLMEKGGHLSELMKNYTTENTASKVESAEPSKEDVQDNDQTPLEFIKPEKRHKGAVTWRIYKIYLKALGYFYPPMFLLIFLAQVIGQISFELFLVSALSSESLPSNFLSTYVIIGLTIAILSMINFTLPVFMGIAGSVVMHDSALAGMVRAPIEFFETQPVGRILNRMSSDVSVVDGSMLNFLVNFFGSLLGLCVSISMVVQATWYIIIALTIFSLAIIYVYQFFQASNREMKRLSSLQKSPLDAWVSESLTGIEIANTCNLGEEFLQEHHQRLDAYQASNYIKQSAESWVQVRMACMASIISLGLILFGVIAKQTAIQDNRLPASIGLALTASITFSHSLQRFLFWLGEGEVYMNSIERLGEYAHDLILEPDQDLPSDPLPALWPTVGHLRFEDITVTYPQRPDHPVIDKVSASIQPGEKVAIVGRTGSGKSTLVSTLFRLRELHRGAIILDGKGSLN
jgi:ABC-type multidrug transport system fused ATPase/permease subunit